MWPYVFLIAPVPVAWLVCGVYDWILAGADALEDVPS